VRVAEFAAFGVAEGVSLLARSLLPVSKQERYPVAEADQTRSVTTEKEFEHPVDAVWRAMTDSEWLAVWFFPNDIQPVLGHKFTIWSRPIERWDGEFKCQLLAITPGEMLQFSWSGGHEELKGFGRFMATTVTWTISALPNGGTRFVFVQDGIEAGPGGDALYDILSKGAESVLRSLTKRLPQLIEHGA
jgi:uncharacterized protein YndB with AHSA1/START domain